MSVLSEVNQRQLERDLVLGGAITDPELERAKKEAKQAKQSILTFLVSSKRVTQEQLTKSTAKVLAIPYVNLLEAEISPDILKLLPKDVAQRFMAVPLGELDNDTLAVAMLDAGNIQAVDYLSQKIEHQLKVYMASEAGIRNVIGQYDDDVEGGMSSVLEDDELDSLRRHGQEGNGEAGEGKDGKDGDGAPSEAEKIKTIVQDSPISRALTAILEFAVKSEASDIHVEPIANALKIRIRVDGVMREIMKLPKSTEAAFVSRVKILSNLKIDEHRIPQDGQFTVHVGDKEVDLRIAISPVVWGEQIVIRILDKTGTDFELQSLGYYGRALRTIKQGLKKPNGMILTSGPTGSGKSTSLYALIKQIKSDEINIVTLEDPVEYKMEGVNQIQVNADVGLSFASGLRSILRQDPDVVMVGEIRDKETATLAVQAALTGHLVFSTLHTNSAAGVLPRLLDMGIEPFLIASTVNTVIGQRLVRKIGANPVAYESSKSETTSVQQALGRLLPKSQEEMPGVARDLGYQALPLLNQNAYTLYKGAETRESPGGYKGRVGLYEVYDVNEQLEDLILNHATASEVHKKAQEMGMVSMREDGYLKALAGLTTIEEVNRVAAIESM